MGYVHASIELSNPGEPDLKPITIQALACLDALHPGSHGGGAEAGAAIGAGGHRGRWPHDARSLRRPVKVTFQDRLCLVGALVLGDDVLLGAVPMEDMDLTIHPSRQQLEPDPRHPTTPHALVKRAAHNSRQPGQAPDQI